MQSHNPDAVKETSVTLTGLGTEAGFGLTEEGFLYLHTIFIQRGRLETTWTVLRKFGYAEDLRLRESFLCPKYVHSSRHDLLSLTHARLVPRFEVPSDCSVELSQKGYQFFTDLFEAFDKVRGAVISTLDTCPKQDSRTKMGPSTQANLPTSSARLLETHGRA